MTPDDLALFGRYLYGERWQTPMADALGIVPRMVRHWMSGERPIPVQRQAEIVRLARETHEWRLREEPKAWLAFVGSISGDGVRGLLTQKALEPLI